LSLQPDSHFRKWHTKLKALLRKAGRRTVDGLWEFLGQILDAFSAQEYQNSFHHCGYHATQT